MKIRMLLEKLNMYVMEVTRFLLFSTEISKILNGLNPEYWKEMFRPPQILLAKITFTSLVITHRHMVTKVLE